MPPGAKTKLCSSATSFGAYVQQIANMGMVILGVYLISEGELSMGGLIASVMLSGRCLGPMAQIAGWQPAITMPNRLWMA